MRRDDLTDAEWERVAALLPDGDRDGRSADDRTVINGLLYQARTGVRWRHLPDRYGCWVTIYKRHRRWLADGTWQRLTLALTADSTGTARVGRSSPPDPGFPRAHHPGSPGTPPLAPDTKDAAVLASLQALLGDAVRPREP
ncbi:transposase [Nonomuraea candida]|uniref:transposase n=1 Tax=Nonomuraea candida TaxID=359159 RepID=UPI000694B3A5